MQAPARSAPRRREGQVLIMTLFAMTLLVGVMFYVYNVGDQVNRRLEMQGAADATAISGADWMARNMNLVAMNNVAMTKMIAEVPILDAQPLASAMALDEVTQWELALRNLIQQARVDPNISPATEQYLRDGIESLRSRMEIAARHPAAYAPTINLPQFDMESITHYSRPGYAPGDRPHGIVVAGGADDAGLQPGGRRFLRRARPAAGGVDGSAGLGGRRLHRSDPAFHARQARPVRGLHAADPRP